MLDKYKPRLLKPKRVAPIAAGQGKAGTGSAWGISANDVDAFLFQGKVLEASSSNWLAYQYLINEKELIVQYKGDGHFAYSHVSEQEALSLVNAPSKGEWGWNNLRVRGSKTSHRKPFRQVTGFRKVI